MLRGQGRGGFTLMELLVVIAVIAILAGLLIPAVMKAKKTATQVMCISNLNQLGTAFQMYVHDNRETFPSPASMQAFKTVDEDWIWWQQDRDIGESAIVPYIERFEKKLFTCPVHKEARDLQGRKVVRGDPYRYSYSFTSYGLVDESNPGMATLITQEDQVYRFRRSEVRRPSRKAMLVEEHVRYLDDGRWVPGNPEFPEQGVLEGMRARDVGLTGRHNGQGTAAFTDGHVESVSKDFGANLTNSLPGL